MIKTTERQVGNAVVLTVEGRLEGLTSQDFLEDLLPRVKAAAARGQPIVLDFAGVHHMTSSGERALMLAQREAKAGKTIVVIAAMQPMVKEIFEISHFDTVLPRYETVDEALASLASEK